MRGQRGFALAVVLLLMPVLAMMAWTFLKVGSVARAQSLQEERSIRALHAAEAGIRLYLATATSQDFDLNDCKVQVAISQGRVISTATPTGSPQSMRIILEVDRGFVTRRLTNEED